VLSADEFGSRVVSYWSSRRPRHPPAHPKEAVGAFSYCLEKLLLACAPRNNRVVSVLDEETLGAALGLGPGSKSFLVTGTTPEDLRSIWLQVWIEGAEIYLELKLSDGTQDVRDLEFGKDVGTSADNLPVMSALILSSLRFHDCGYRSLFNVPARVSAMNPKTGQPRNPRSLARLYRSLGFEDIVTPDGQGQILHLTREDRIQRLSSFSSGQLSIAAVDLGKILAVLES
jgi:hypothetical protein